ncbi:MAG: flagellar biosynthesis protein FlhA [Planctomycetota bacterium]|jgi:flagellar biosynthesis protein FlhA
MSDSRDNSALAGASKGVLGRLVAQNDILFACGIAVVLATLLIPLPTMLLDLLLSCSIGIALAVMVVVLSARESVELSTFPSLLLFLTLFRLSLNVASTRLILLNGNAGRIIETFGHFVVGGNLVIGLVVFLILVIIQFVVITKGSERISEVAARFNLDAMPGKQMAIDADLNAGLIGEEEARHRREKIAKESEFYGAMDGASKFIRGDAIAGLVITAINLLGGFLVGMMQGKTASESMGFYAILAIGDGLVSQIPALIIATSSGFLISKTSTLNSLSHDLMRQLLRRSRPIGIAAFLLAAMVLVPGFPKAPFVILALAAGFLSRKLSQQERISAEAAATPKETPKPEEQPVEELLDVDRISLLVGPRLIKVIDPRRKDSLSHRISPLRRKFVQQFGVILPLVRLRDSLTLDANAYEIRLNNHVVATGRLEADRMLAMDPGSVQSPMDGQATTEPVFNLPALWITPEQKDDAEVRGYTVVDPESVLVTHLSEVLRQHAYELLNRDDVQVLIDRLEEKQPTLVSGAVGDQMPVGLIHRVLQFLLKDGLPIRDLSQILETLGDNATRTKEPMILTELCRKALVRTITEEHTDDHDRVLSIVLDPSLEYELRESLAQQDGGEGLTMAPERAMELNRQIVGAWTQAMEAGLDKTVLLCDYRVRPHLAAMLSRQLPQLAVLAYDEITVGTQIESVGTVAVPSDIGGPESLPQEVTA